MNKLSRPPFAQQCECAISLLDRVDCCDSVRFKASDRVIVGLCGMLLRRRAQAADAQELVGRAGQPHQQRVAFDAVQAGLSKAANAVAPADELLDAFAHNLAGAMCLWRSPVTNFCV